MYVISILANHPKKGKTKYHEQNQKVFNEFLRNPGKYYYSVFTSFFRFLGLFVDNDSVMIHMK